MSGKIFQFTNTFGVFNGIKLYLNQKYNKPSVVRAPFLKHPVYFRGQQTKSDLLIFRQIFHSENYNIVLPVEPKVIIDLGANVGFASVYFANRFPDAAIIALEPNEANYLSAYENVKKYENIQLIQGAAWHKNEEVQVVDNGYGEAAFMIEVGTRGNSVKALTIKNLMDMASAKLIDVLKMDVEGSEKEIFESGYEEWLPNTKILIVETHDRYKKGSSKSVLTAIAKYDFSLEISGESLVFYNNNFVNPY